MKFRDHWDEWGWLIALGMMVFATGVGLLGRETFCSEKDVSCIREWVSALGGWAAVVAAIPTVLYLSKQVSSAAQHQRVNFELEIRSKLTLARAAKQNSIEARYNMHVTGKYLREAANRVQQIGACRAQFKAMIELLGRPVFSEFEMEISLPTGMTIATLSSILASSSDDIANDENVALLMENEEVFAEKFAHYQRVIERCRDYLQSLSEAADAFIGEMADLKSQIT